jgi:hypothetical protein
LVLVAKDKRQRNTAEKLALQRKKERLVKEAKDVKKSNVLQL